MAPRGRRPEKIDLATLPLEGLLRQAMGEGETASAAVNLLGLLQRLGRGEAGIFLLGLLAAAGEDWKRREELVRALDGFHTPGYASFLYDEFRRVKGSNATRRYLNAVLKALEQMPTELVKDKLGALAEDPCLSPRMRQKAAQAYWRVVFRQAS